MIARLKKRPRIVKIGGVILAALGLLALTFFVIHFITGRGVGVRSLPYALPSVVRAILNRDGVLSYSRGEYTNVVFLHHSTGEGLIRLGGLREKFAEAGYNFWDHGLNSAGLRDPFGNYTGYSYIVPRDDTNPAGLFGIFSQPEYGIPLDTFSALMQHEVIILKSCFLPGNQITSEQQIEEYRSGYLAMRDRMDQRPDKIFILMTTPPVNPAETTPEAAARARRVAEWLASPEFVTGHPNVFVYDFYGILVENDPASPDYSMLRADYRDGADSHPNRLANKTIGPLLAEFVIETVESYRASTGQ